MHKAVMSFLIAVVFIVLAGCNEYKVQICTGANRIDIAGLEGEHVIYLQDPESLQMTEQPFGVEHLGVGSYSAAGVVELHTCKFGDKVIIEAQNLVLGQDTFSSYFVSKGEVGFDLIVAAFDRQKLSQSGIPFQQESRSLFGRMDYPVLNVDNQNMAPEELVKMLHPTSMVIKIY